MIDVQRAEAAAVLLGSAGVWAWLARLLLRWLRARRAATAPWYARAARHCVCGGVLVCSILGVAFLLAAAVAALVVPFEETSSPAVRYNIPCARPDSSSLLFVSATAANGRRLKLVLDTGANTTLLTRAGAQKVGAGLRYPRRRMEPSVGWAGVPKLRRIGLLDGLHLGGIAMPPLRTVVAEAGDCPFLGEFGADGIIGLEAFANSALELDLGKPEVTVWRGGHLTRERRSAAGFGAAPSAPVILHRDRCQAEVPAVIEGREHVSLLLDTGAAYSCVPRSTARALHLHPAIERERREGYLSTGYVRVMLLRSLRLGGQEASGILVDSPASARSRRYDHILGLDVLARYRLLIDFPAGAIWFAPTRATSSSGADLELEPAPHGPWLVHSTGSADSARSDRPHAGDWILSINGMSTTGMDVQRLRAALRDAYEAGSPILVREEGTNRLRTVWWAGNAPGAASQPVKPHAQRRPIGEPMLRFLAIAASSYLLSFSVHFLLFTGAALLWDLLARQRATNGEGLRAIAIVSLCMAIFDAPLAMYFAYAMGLFGG